MSEKPTVKRRLSIRTVTPNVVTILALMAGVTGIKFAIAGRYEDAVFAVILAGVFDGLDGNIARLLKSASRFGAELDSLSDVVAFGVAPAIILYLWGLNALGGMGWVISLAFVVCQALRLARFNAKLDEDDTPRMKAGYLTGIPAPVGAALAFFPMILTFVWGESVLIAPEFLGIYIAVLCALMVSKIATFSFKRIIVSKDQMVPLLLVIALLAASLTVYGWRTISLIGVLYLISIPITGLSYHRQVKKNQSLK